MTPPSSHVISCSLRLCGFLVCLLTGCAKEHIPTYPPMPAAQAMQILADRSRAIHSISAQGLITLTRDDGDTVRLDAAIVLQPPTHARLRAWKFGRAVFDMTLTPQGLWLVAPQEGRQRDEILAAGSNTAKLTREWIGLIAGGMDLAKVDAADGKLLLTQPRPDGSTLLCTVDARTLTPRRYQLKDAAGVERFSLSLNHYATVGNLVWPHEIEAVSGRGRIVIELHDVEINAELPAGAFHPPARAQKIPEPSP